MFGCTFSVSQRISSYVSSKSNCLKFDGICNGKYRYLLQYEIYFVTNLIKLVRHQKPLIYFYINLIKYEIICLQTIRRDTLCKTEGEFSSILSSIEGTIKASQCIVFKIRIKGCKQYCMTAQYGCLEKQSFKHCNEWMSDGQENTRRSQTKHKAPHKSFHRKLFSLIYLSEFLSSS